jgi:putative protease
VETEVKEIRVDLKPVPETKKGEYFSVQIDQKIRRADKLYKLVASRES